MTSDDIQCLLLGCILALICELFAQYDFLKTDLYRLSREHPMDPTSSLAARSTAEYAHICKYATATLLHGLGAANSLSGPVDGNIL